MSTFNPETFLNTTTDAANSTSAMPVPAGEYTASVKDIKARTTASGKAILDVTWSVDDQSGEVEAATGIKNATIRQSVFLDVTEQGGLDSGKGRNVQLGRLRTALNQNTAGRPWQPGMLIGGVARITVSHRQDGEDTYADVKGVAAI